MTEETTEPSTVETTEGEPAPDAIPEPSTAAGKSAEPEVIDETTTEDADTFPRSYVERLRRESANYRERANTADTYAQRLQTELVRATGRLADPTDLAFDQSHLDDPNALAAAIDELLARKPDLASRRPTGDIGQGAVSGVGSSVDLAADLRERAR
jgi:hypothetical protein